MILCMHFKFVVGYFACLLLARHTFFYLDVYPTVTFQYTQIVLGYYFVRDVLEGHAHVFEVIKNCAIVIILDVNGHEFGPLRQ